MSENQIAPEAPPVEAAKPVTSRRKRNLIPFASFKYPPVEKTTEPWPGTKPLDPLPEMDEKSLRVIITIEIRGKNFEVHCHETEQIVPKILQAAHRVPGEKTVTNVLMDNVNQALTSCRDFLESVNPVNTPKEHIPRKGKNVQLLEPAVEPMPVSTYQQEQYPDEINITPPKKD